MADNIDWGDWVSGTIDPKVIMNPTINFENRRVLGRWEYRTGTLRPPVIDHLHIYSADLNSWTLDTDGTQQWNIVIETADGVPNGSIIIKRL